MWNKYFIKIAYAVSEKSKDPDTKVGCVIVGPDREIRMTGFNGLPKGCEDLPERYERPEKYKWIEHSERNAIYMAARLGTSLQDCHMYITAPPCEECARGIIQAGIKSVTYPIDHVFKDRKDWKEDLESAEEILLAAGVPIIVSRE